jgi:hypothetical protein
MLLPDQNTKQRFYDQVVSPLLEEAGIELVEDERRVMEENVISNGRVSFSHLHELELLSRRLAVTKPQSGAQNLLGFVRDLPVILDRFGQFAPQRQALLDRAQQSDPRMLLSALEIADAFKRVSELALAAMVEEKVPKG